LLHLTSSTRKLRQSGVFAIAERVTRSVWFVQVNRFGLASHEFDATVRAYSFARA
jgi:hypothetical protein